ncbi:helix-turn-helix domain-containing protein [Paenibacillus sp. Marseille-Q4541]|uniref:helix-turn-helix domain-containing protein n=1 Tax=Paenibacillus sp. Marseille-Q4541 TaxID=2831522 RepID=UPI001BA96912|nr:helix-turn-helix domain-containing protein [Paenibacillus sp. Marseille-Q4541]
MNDLLRMEHKSQGSPYSFLDPSSLISKDKNLEAVSRQSVIVYQLLELVHRHYADSDISLSTIARQRLYMNPDYLGKVFKRITGMGFSQYLNQYRIQQACSYMRQKDQDAKIFELAEWFGFGGNPQYFSQVFKKWTGVTPSDFRSRAR